jgi:hypothetical protein
MKIQPILVTLEQNEKITFLIRLRKPLNTVQNSNPTCNF